MKRKPGLSIFFRMYPKDHSKEKYTGLRNVHDHKYLNLQTYKKGTLPIRVLYLCRVPKLE